MPSKHDTRALLARYCGLSPVTFDKALAVIQAAQNDPDRFAGVVEQLDRTGNVDRAFHAVIYAEHGPRSQPGANFQGSRDRQTASREL